VLEWYVFIGNYLLAAHVNWFCKRNQVVLDRIIDARLYAFDLVDGEIHVKFDEPIVAAQYSKGGMCN
jgi:hypothetical protein